MRDLISIASLPLLLSACAAPQPSEYERTLSADDRWGVGAKYPVYAEMPCKGDSSVEIAVQSADLPSSHLGFRLTSDATEENAIRVAACLEEHLDSGKVSISSPGP